ncbi:MAG: polyphosphate kinase 1 [Oscillospiraceae bacterium]|jgi:polyphosphate kinase|nr:polyphosphate kinase 1 [Oscillospiraceae bacterium]
MQSFINRELSWLDFNQRVLAQTWKPETLLLDRLKFAAISASNLDEFFMVRVAYLNDRKKEGKIDDAGLSSMEQLEYVLERSYDFQLEQSSALDELLGDLRCQGIYFLNLSELNSYQLGYIKSYFEHEVMPVITPLAIDPTRPFPMLGNKSLNIGVRMRDKNGKNVYAVIQVPSILPRFVALPSDADDKRYFLPLEELITYFLGDICNLYKIRAYGYFRITRSADFDADEETDNLLEEMKRTIKKRKRGKPIRLELSAPFDGKMREFLHSMLKINSRFIFEIPSINNAAEPENDEMLQSHPWLGQGHAIQAIQIDIAAFMKVTSIKGFEHLSEKSITPVFPKDFCDENSPFELVDIEDDDKTEHTLGENIFTLIRERDRMVHHPYESFDVVTDFINAAADDPDVLAIKQTLYRVSGKSRVVAALERAAEAGKQVTVLVELKARFDEENNIEWASQLEKAGCHVIYGLTGLKTHCKITLVVRRESDGIRRYLHLSTGNYNDVTAKVYTDIGMFTCRNEFGEDASALFNHLTGYSIPPKYNKFAVAPEHLKPFFIEKIDNEIRNAKNGLPSGITFKVNSLLGSVIVRKLYEASQAGVKINLLVRGICSLVPGIKGISENITVRSIVGRFLEHSRIFIFENANAADPDAADSEEPGSTSVVYMGSADLMPRNLDRRVELVFPVEEPILKNRIKEIMDLMWSDNVCSWEMNSFGQYSPAIQTGTRINAQEQLTLEN